MNRFARFGFALLLGVAWVAAGVPARSATEVRIAVLDSGIISNYEFPAGQVVAWKDFVNNVPVPYDDRGHGTAVASRVAGRTLGVFPGARLIIGKVLSSDNIAHWVDVAAGIRWAADQNADIINISIWATAPDPERSLITIGRAIDYATSHGSLVVWIAGNGRDVSIDETFDVTMPYATLSWPSTFLVGASSPQVLVVGSTDGAGVIAPDSQLDPELVTHGRDVVALWNDGTYRFVSGTSYAAPRAAGILGQLIADGAPRDPSWLKWVLTHVSIDREQYTYLDEGYGWLNGMAVATARSIARGERPVPPPDGRDAFHVAVSAARVAQTASAPTGTLPPAA